MPQPNQISEHDLFGVFFLKLPGSASRENYYRTVDASRLLLESQGWNESITGFYLNISRDSAMRLSYFTGSPERAIEVAKSFIAKTGLEEIQKAEAPLPKSVSKAYGGEEVRFRRYLSTYTAIGLDIMGAGLLHAQCLFATFRLQVMLPREPYRPHFENSFVTQSAFYRSLTAEDKEQFWHDFSHWPNPPQVDWAHMFVNMVLGCDWPIDGFLQKQNALTTTEINRILQQCNLGFQIP